MNVHGESRWQAITVRGVLLWSCLLLVAAWATMSLRSSSPATADPEALLLPVLEEEHRILSSTLADVERDLAGAWYVLDWMDEERIAGSAGLIDSIRDLLEFPAPRLGFHTVAEGAMDGSAEWRRYVVEGEGLRSIPPAHEAFLAGLESRITRGAWLHLWQLAEPGTYPVDYRETVRTLANGGFQAETRGLIRALRQRKNLILALVAMNERLQAQAGAVNGLAEE